MISCKGHRERGRGFSLVELLVTIAISAAITAAIASLLYSQMQLSTCQNRNMLNQANVRDVIKFMVDEMQLAGTADGSEPLITADANAYSFYADIDDNDVFDRIDYYLNDENTLMRRYTTQVSGTQFIADDPLLQHVQYLNFTYFGADDAAPTNISEITSVEVRLELDTSAIETAFTSGRLAPQRMIGRATLRNKTLGSIGP